MVEDWVQDGADDLPGCGVTLALLYYFVPTAEEVDLLDVLDRERRQAHWNELYDEVVSVEGTFDTEDAEARQAHEHFAPVDAPMSIGQILGMLEHLLGAEILDDPDLGEANQDE